MSYNKGGFEPRFNITRTDGKEISPDRRYIVLDYANDPHAKKALSVYADSIEKDNPVMARDLRQALITPEKFPSQHS